MADAELPVQDRQHAHRAPRRGDQSVGDPCRRQAESVWSGGPQARQTGVNAPELNLSEDPVERIAADRRLAPRNDKPRRRCAEDGEHHFRRRAAGFERNDCPDGACKRLGRRADQTAAIETSLALKDEEQVGLSSPAKDDRNVSDESLQPRHHRQRGLAAPFLLRAPRIRNHQHRASGDARDVVRALDPRVAAFDSSRLLDVECLAGGDRSTVVDEEHAPDTFASCEGMGSRTADLTGAEDADSAHQSVGYLSWVSALKGKVAVVTGGSRGIGRAIADALLNQGASVVISGTNRGHLEAATKHLASHPGRMSAVQADVRSYTDVEALITTAVKEFGGLDILVNNAGVGVFNSVAETTVEEWHRVLDTNLSGVFYCCHAAIPHFRQRGGGWIINISSLASKNPFVNGGAYCASKSALNAFSETLMQEVRYDGIRVAYVLPGSVNTGFGGLSNTKSDWALMPEDVAQAVVDLVAFPARSLPSRVEIRPAQPPRKG
jgi:3-oxoacyl-[acyl-carrier protein] reductase